LCDSQRFRAQLLEFLNFRLLDVQDLLFNQTADSDQRRTWLTVHYSEALQLNDADPEHV